MPFSQHSRALSSSKPRLPACPNLLPLLPLLPPASPPPSTHGGSRRSRRHRRRSLPAQGCRCPGQCGDGDSGRPYWTKPPRPPQDSPPPSSRSLSTRLSWQCLARVTTERGRAGPQPRSPGPRRVGRPLAAWWHVAICQHATILLDGGAGILLRRELLYSLAAPHGRNISSLDTASEE